MQLTFIDRKLPLDHSFASLLCNSGSVTTLLTSLISLSQRLFSVRVRHLRKLFFVNVQVSRLNFFSVPLDCFPQRTFKSYNYIYWMYVYMYVCMHARLWKLKTHLQCESTSTTELEHKDEGKHQLSSLIQLGFYLAPFLWQLVGIRGRIDELAVTLLI